MNKEKYTDAFVEAFEIDREKAEGMVKDAEEWDSVGHMMLIAALEEKFGIELEPEEMLAITSFYEGLTVLRDKGIVFSEET